LKTVSLRFDFELKTNRWFRKKLAPIVSEVETKFAGTGEKSNPTFKIKNKTKSNTLLNPPTTRNLANLLCTWANRLIISGY
jgi:hypothetical protein